MTTYIAILRGINVSGHRIIKMDALQQLLVSINFQNIHTYIQSGNIIFQYKKTATKQLEQKIATAITAKFTFDVPVIVREIEEFQQIVSNNPFLKDKTKDITHLHITFLSDKPNPEYFDAIKEGQYQADEFHLVDKAVYLYCPNGYGNTKLTNSFFENKLKVIATTRNLKTTHTLQNMANEISNL